MNFELIKKTVADTIKNSLNNYGVDDKKIVVNKIYYDDKNINKINNWSNLQKLKNKNRSMTIPIYADIGLKKGNKLVSKQSKINIGQLPVATKNDSFLIDGIEYNVPLQLRRDPGIYTSQSDNGLFVTAINSAKGRNYKIELDPNTNVQKINIDGSRINLLPILKTLGHDKKNIIKAWGNNDNAKMLYDINERAAETAHGKKAIQKLYKKLEYNANANATDEDMRNSVIKYFDEKTSFNPQVNKVTLGTAYDKLSPKAFLDISRKLIDVSSGAKPADDTENLMFKHVKLVDHLLSKKIETDFKKKLTASLTRNIKNKDTIKDIIQPGLFTKSIKSFFNESKIAEPSEQINPLHMISTRDKITLKGEGGITNEHTVSMDMKALHPSYFGFIDPLHTPDGAPGLVNHIALGASIDSTEKLSNMFYDAKNGKLKRLTVVSIFDKYIATPDQYTILPNKKPIPKSNRISAFYRNKSEEVSPNKVDFILAHGSHMFDPSTNLVPFINSSSGNRISMSGKHSEQTISLINREAPLVSTLSKNKKEFVSLICDRFNIKSPITGIVKKITPKEITIMDSKRKNHIIELRDNLELNQESFYHDEPVVKIGSKVKKDQLLAKNNWTDNKGRLSLGINAKVGYFPYKGYNIEDGIVISSDFAKKITSQHLHVQEIHPKKGELNFPKFKINFKNKYTPESYSKLDEDGIVKNGSVVTKGNVIIAYAKPFDISEEDKILGKLSKGLKKRLMDQSVVWHYDFPGKVVDVIKSANLVKVKIKSEQPAEITDKLSGRYGNKGIISNIVPTNEMPMTADGEPLEVILNPHGVASRINSSQLYEAALGKIAKKTGNRYLIENFAENNNWDYVQKELKKHNVQPNETVIDPNTKKELKTWNPVTKKYEHPFVGIGYIDKSVHQTRKKFDARSRGAYSINDMPSNDPEASHYLGSSASKQNPKSVDRLTLYSLLAHGSKNVVRDMFTNKGQRRDDVWEAIINGYKIPPPKISTATEKGFSMLKAAGINMQRKGRFIVFPALTDKDTISLSSGKIPKPNLFLRGKNLMPIKGGMFDINLTGGTQNSTRYNHIDMGVKIPNPITKNAIKSLLDLSESDFNDILKGVSKKDGLTGVDYFEKSLEKMKVDNEIERLNIDKKTAPKTKINIINRKLKYLMALKNNHLKPIDYMISKYPVIPSKFRPIIPLPNGTIEPAPINNIYRDVGLVTNLLKNKAFPKFIKNEAIYELYNTISGLQGVTEPTANVQNSAIGNRNLRSVLDEFGGTGSPKGGYLHSNLLSKTQDYIGNSVIAVSPNLGIDEVGIPYKMAEIMYEPFILRKLKTLGYKVNDFKTIKEKNPKLINDILNGIVKERPVIINRNPSLHKGSVMAFNPVLLEGSAIKLNPLILSPFNADFDGDQMPVHVPISKEAVEQAYKMIPSLNFYNPKNDTAHINFDQEYVAGISLMSENGQKTNLKFANIREAKEAYDKNLFRISDFITIGGKHTTLGREELSQIIPKEFNIDTNKVFKKKDISDLLAKMVTDGGITKYTDVVNKLKDVGAKYSYDEGYSFSINDLKPREDIRKKYLNPTLPLIKKHISDGNIDRAKQLITHSAGNAQKYLVKDNYDKHNRFFLPANYGARKISPDVMQQITTTPYFAAGMKDALIEAPIKKSYSEGLDVHDSFNMYHGARKALVDKVNTVREPGVVTKDLIASFSGVNIMADDCGTHEGVPVEIDDTFNLQGRVLAKKVNGLPAGTVLDTRHLNELRKGSTKEAIVRSPLTCILPKGVCGKCYGYNEYHQLPRVGDPIGIKAAQSLGETGTQSALSSHHLGGTVAAGSFRSGFEYTKHLLGMHDTVKNKAILAMESGTVVSIKKGVNNQYILTLDSDPNPYILRNEPLVKKGDRVKKGQPLDSGHIKLQELAELVPMSQVQSYLTKELEKSYAGTKILRRNTETIVKGVTDYSKVTNSGKSPFLEEDIVPNNLIEWIKKGNPINPEDVIGWRLGKSVDKYSKGDIIDIDMVNDLLKKNITKVVVDSEGLETKNILLGINAIPLVQPDLIKKMSYQRIRSALKEGPISGEYSNIHGAYPEPALVIGTEFGLPGFNYY